MRYGIILEIEEGRSTKYEVDAISAEHAAITIIASTIHEAVELIPQLEVEALEAMNNWQPEEQKPKEEPERHYEVSTYSIEEMDEDWQIYAESPAGQRLIKKIDNAKKFKFKHTEGGYLQMSELIHLVNKYHNNLINGYFDLTALAYRHGYRHGQKAAKARKGAS